MRRKGWLALAAALCIAAVAWAAQEMSVQVQQTALRGRPSYLGPVTADLAYGDRVSVIADRGPWHEVRTADGRTGWVHASALTPKKVVLQAGEADVATGASTDDLALAGKGFNEEVEAVYRADTDLDYTWVDRMQSWTVSPAQAAAFLTAGGVTPREGGV